MNQTTTQTSPFAAAIFKLLNVVELIAFAVAGVGFAMMYAGMEGAPEILMPALSVLAATFFLGGYQPRPAPPQKEGEPKAGLIELLGSTIVPKVGWIGCSVMTVGILFRILNLKGNQEMLMIACAILPAALLLTGIFVVSKPERSAALMPMVYRAVPLCLAGLYLFMS
jgi:hypothetical protein